MNPACPHCRRQVRCYLASRAALAALIVVAWISTHTEHVK